MRYGIPEEVVSDEGPEFDNKMMREFVGFLRFLCVEVTNVGFKGFLRNVSS